MVVVVDDRLARMYEEHSFRSNRLEVYVCVVPSGYLYIYLLQQDAYHKHKNTHYELQL